MAKAIDMRDIFPIYKVEHDALLSVWGDMTIAFEVELPEIFTLSDPDYQALHHAWVNAIKILPVGSIFQKQDWFTQVRYKAVFDDEKASFLSRSSEAFFNERPGMDHKCYVLLTKKADGRKPASSLYSGLLRKSIVPKEALSNNLISEFLDACSAFERILTDSGYMTLRRLNDDELAGTGNRPGLLEKYCSLQTGDDKTIRDIHLADGIRIGDNHGLLYTLADAEDLPAVCGSRISHDKYSTDRSKFSMGFASALGQLLPCNHILNQFIFIEDPAKTIKQLESKKLRLHSLSAYSRENAVSHDAVNEYLDEAVAFGRQPVKAHFNVFAWTDQLDTLPEIRKQISSAMAKLNATTKQETDGAAQIWWAGLPGNAADFPLNDTFDTFLEQATCFLNLESCYRSSRSPFGIRFGDRVNGMPVHVDISQEPIQRGWVSNMGKFVIGPSGSGKSFLLCHMLRSYYEQGAHIVIVDIGHSYKSLCELVGGYYFTYSEENPIKFNPFYIPKGDTLDTEKKESIKTLLLTLWKKDDEPYRRSEYVAISNALTLYYEYLAANPSVFPGFNSFYEFLMEHYLLVLENGDVKEKDFDAGNFLFVLNPYYKGGEYDYLLNATDQLDLLQERFIVYEIDVLKDHPILFPVVTIIIMEMFISKMRKLNGIRKVILLEEVWKAIAKAGMAEYVKYLFKTVRKFNGEPIVVTQEIEDIISSPIVKQAIINNADCKILLDQRKYIERFDEIQAMVGLTDKEKAQVLSINRNNDPTKDYREVFISLGGHSKVYRTEVSLEEHLSYSTKPVEKLEVGRYALRYGSLQKGIAMLASEIRAGTKVIAQK